MVGFDLPTALTALQETATQSTLAWYCLTCADDNYCSTHLHWFCWNGRRSRRDEFRQG